jgi:hypothetical protein
MTVYHNIYYCTCFHYVANLWVQVSDDEADELMTPRRKKEPLGLNLDTGNDQSYRMTQSGLVHIILSLTFLF